MKIVLAAVAQRSRNGLFDSATETYLRRIAAYATIETAAPRDERTLIDSLDKLRARSACYPVFLDHRGKTFSSEEFAQWLRSRRDSGEKTLVFAVGPPDGWRQETIHHAQMLLSLGPMTLPHEMARLVLAEQLYRAFTILAGHPYHCGH